jgi:NAD(P)H-hydrate epimerase
VKSVTVKQIQALDKAAINGLGIPSLVLMENAGRSVAVEVLRLLKGKRRAKVCIVCGLGNNAGDGFVTGRHILNAGICPSIFLIGRGRDLKQDAAVNYRILKKLKYPVTEITSADGLLRRVLSTADVVIDAVFGVGLNREVEGPFRSVLEAINIHAKKVVSVDIPSGLDGTTGEMYGVCVKAHQTVTFSFAKRGFFKNEGPRHVGQVTVVDIGIPLRFKNKV